MVGAAVIAPVGLPAVRTRPQTAIKAGLVAYDQGRVRINDETEGGSDLIEEAHQELAEQRSTPVIQLR